MINLTVQELELELEVVLLQHFSSTNKFVEEQLEDISSPITRLETERDEVFAQFSDIVGGLDYLPTSSRPITSELVSASMLSSLNEVSPPQSKKQAASFFDKILYSKDAGAVSPVGLAATILIALVVGVGVGQLSASKKAEEQHRPGYDIIL